MIKTGRPLAAITWPMSGQSDQRLGYLGIVTAVVIWGAWIVATRESVTRDIAPWDIAVLRYGAPVLVLFPLILRRGLFPKGEDWRVLAVMTLGWGAPFVMLISGGLQTVEVSVFGPMVPATLPFFVAAYDRIFGGVRITLMRGVGMGLIAMSILLAVWTPVMGGDAGFYQGAGLLVCAALGWSSFTLAYRHCGLSGVEAAAYVCFYSLPIMAAAGLFMESRFLDMTWGDVLWNAFIQGVCSGIIAVAGYNYAIHALGAARASTFTSLVPVLAAVGAYVALGEEVSLAGWFGVGFACLGVAVVNGAFTRRPAPR